MMQPQNGRVSITLGASDTHWTCNMSKTQTRRMLSFRLEISCYHSVTSLCWLTCQPNQRASWDFSELIGKTASLFLWYYKHILRYLILVLPTAILPLGRKMKLLRSKQIQEVKKRIVLTSLESLNTPGHKAAWLFESLSDVRKTFPLLLKLIWMAFLSFAMTRILPTTALYSDQLTWPSRIICFLLMDSSHRKQDSCISEEDTQHNLLPLETIILLYCIRMSPVEV